MFDVSLKINPPSSCYLFMGKGNSRTQFCLLSFVLWSSLHILGVEKNNWRKRNPTPFSDRIAEIPSTSIIWGLVSSVVFCSSANNMRNYSNEYPQVPPLSLSLSLFYCSRNDIYIVISNFELFSKTTSWDVSLVIQIENILRARENTSSSHGRHCRL